MPDNAMVHIPGGEYQMGSENFALEERPAHPVRISPFLLDRAPVTVAQFARFVDHTGYVTIAERAADPRDYPGVDPAVLVPGAMVFAPTAGPVPLTNPTAWWRWVPGASWRHPEGPGSDALAVRAEHPVTQVCWEDAHAFATWADKRLPTEAEHEYAACGGEQPHPYAWGTQRFPEGKLGTGPPPAKPRSGTRPPQTSASVVHRTSPATPEDSPTRSRPDLLTRPGCRGSPRLHRRRSRRASMRA